MPITSFRSRLTVLAVAAAALGAVLPAVAPADSGGVRPTDVGSWTVTEGQTATLRVKLTCQRGYGPCTFVVDAIALTAKRPGDFTATTKPVRSKLKIRRAGRSMIATVAFKAVDDAVCEGTETARVRVLKRTRRKGSRRDYGTVTIKDDDCDTPPTPRPQPGPVAPAPLPGPAAPAPDPAEPFPADSGSPTVTTTALTGGTLTECTTPQWIGTEATAGANGWFNRGCAVKVTCPPTALVCSARAESRHSLERAIDDERVSLNSRITVFSAGDVAYWFRDQSSAGAGFTRNEDPGVMIRGGESARVECNGVRIAPTAPNRSRVGCSLTVERVS